MINKKEYHKVYDNGLNVYLKQINDFSTTIAMISVNYGGRDQEFISDNKKYKMPSGIAHLIEHKLFDQGNYDALTKLTEMGAETNAFTSQTKTNYYVSTVSNYLECIEELLNFTSNTVFENENINKEINIIKQEIKMYEDDVETVIYNAFMSLLYNNDPISEDIAGNINSLQNINKNKMNLVYNEIYNPTFCINMSL